MTNTNQFGKGLILGLSVVGCLGVLTYALTIPSNIENSVQTIKEIRVTSDGTDQGQTIVRLKGDDTEKSVEVFGTLRSGNTGNTIDGKRSTVAGGEDNVVSGVSSTIVGGVLNKIYGDQSSIIGGIQNFIIGNYNILGGYKNILNGLYSLVIGGSENVLTGNYSTILGGYQNRINGNYSIAGGYKAQALNNNVFIWSDSDPSYFPDEFVSAKSNTFLIRSLNGVGINTNNPGATLDVNGTLRVRDESLSGAYALGMTADGTVKASLPNDILALLNGADGELDSDLVPTYWKESSLASGNIYYTGNVMFGTDFLVTDPTYKLWLNTNIRFADPEDNGVERIISAGYSQLYQGANLKFVGGEAGGGGGETNRGGHIILEAGKGSAWGNPDNPGPSGSGGSVVINGGAFGDDGTPSGSNGNVLLANLRGNVGIGTSNPLNKLDVVGNVGIAGWLNVDNNFYVNATTNRVGIGTGSPSELLDVYGATKSQKLILPPQAVTYNNEATNCNSQGFRASSDAPYTIKYITGSATNSGLNICLPYEKVATSCSDFPEQASCEAANGCNWLNTPDGEYCDGSLVGSPTITYYIWYRFNLTPSIIP